MNLAPVTSATFNIFTGLSFTSGPSNELPAATMDAVQVSVVDGNDAVVTGYVGNITLEIGTNPGTPDGTLSGTLTQAAVDGVATFSDLSINNSGDGYTLTASADAGSLENVTSDPFDIGTYSLTITADLTNYNVHTEFLAKYGSPPDGPTLKVAVNAGKVVSATSTAAAAMTWSSAWTGTPTFTFVNKGYVIGKGGAGGGLPTSVQDGFIGGKAVELSGQTVAITNAAGKIWGGGGGGGSGSPGGGGGLGGGGGGAGDGAGGVCTNEPDAPPDVVEIRTGTDGSAPSGALISQIGGTAGLGQHVYILAAAYTSYGGDGGTGGAYGAVGANGTQGYYDPDVGAPINGDYPGGAGGAAGKAINLSAGTANFVSGSGSPNVKGAVS